MTLRIDGTGAAYNAMTQDEILTLAGNDLWAALQHPNAEKFTLERVLSLHVGTTLQTMQVQHQWPEAFLYMERVFEVTSSNPAFLLFWLEAPPAPWDPLLRSLWSDRVHTLMNYVIFCYERQDATAKRAWLLDICQRVMEEEQLFDYQPILTYARQVHADLGRYPYRMEARHMLRDMESRLFAVPLLSKLFKHLFDAFHGNDYALYDFLMDYRSRGLRNLQLTGWRWDEYSYQNLTALRDSLEA